MAEKVTLELLGTKIDSLGVRIDEISVALESLARMTARGFAESRKETFEEFDKVRKEISQLEEKMDKRLQVLK